MGGFGVLMMLIGIGMVAFGIMGDPSVATDSIRGLGSLRGLGIGSSGVVNIHKLHVLEGFFVAGSALFVTGGFFVAAENICSSITNWGDSLRGQPSGEEIPSKLVGDTSDQAAADAKMAGAEMYRGTAIKSIDGKYVVGDSSFEDLALAKTHIDNLWIRQIGKLSRW